jgi:pyruvate,orthophosphate dikinase
MKTVFTFSEGTKDMKDLLGGKGANLAEMTRLGLPVPQGFTLSTAACLEYLENQCRLSEERKGELLSALTKLEAQTGKSFGDPAQPLLVSVRSGSKFSMPGMMDTILNLGLNDDTVEGLAEKTGDPRFAYDCYRRLLMMFGDVVFGIDKQRFEEQLDFYKKQNGYQVDTDLTGTDWQKIVSVYKDIYQEQLQRPFPQEPKEQLFLAVAAVFKSWNNPRAKTYRRLNTISDSLGTAVNIQEMVFGNFGDISGTGVAFTRNPATGEKQLFGEFLINAQGEDVVAGVRTPKPISELADIAPAIYENFLSIGHQLELHYKDMQDIEFTIENGKLFILQTRNGKRTAKAGVKLLVQFVEEGILTEAEALEKVDTAMLTQILHPVFDDSQIKTIPTFAKGLPASPGAATGRLYFTAESAKQAHEAGEKVILVRQETSPEDIEGMVVSEAIVTARGGMTSHAAVVARGMGVCCVVGCESLQVDELLEQVTADGQVIKKGEWISVDGTTGKLYQGELPLAANEEFPLLSEIIDWSKRKAQLKVYANAETPTDIKTALDLGAQGVGLARTEHMFFGKDRIFNMRKLILTKDSSVLKESLAKLKEYQKSDFKQMFELLGVKPCTIRLLDPPLHEFLPKTEAEIDELATAINCDSSTLTQRLQELAEVNPMLGHRGCRLGITMPEIYEMQVAAILEAALDVQATLNEGASICPHIMVPLIGTENEMNFLKENLTAIAETVFQERQQQIPYSIGTMLELPRACLIAGKLADTADFFSFGTNDLTQLTYGYSRDDAGKFLPEYIERGILKDDPFQHLDQEGVGALMKIAIDQIKQAYPEKEIGVCGEVGGDPASLQFLADLGVTYISCSPYRIPAACLTAAKLQISKSK